jgi:parvulin-like peptidyl-prolyl isomerase
VRAPALHFVVIGIALFALGTRRIENSAPVRAPIVINAAQIEAIRADFTRRTGLPPTHADETVMIENAIEEELLYQEALIRGLDRGDRSIRWRLIQKMHFLDNGDDGTERSEADLYQEAIELGLDRDDIVIRRMLTQKMRLLAKRAATDELTDAELRDYLERHRDRYVQPARVTLTHVFVSAEKHKDRVDREAQRILEHLRSGPIPPEQARTVGDVFPLGHHLRSNSQHQLAKMFGPEFAAAAMTLDGGRWHGPVRSAYGLHLVWISDSTPAATPDLEAVRRQVDRALRAERQEERLQATIRELRDIYDVRIEQPTG